MEQIKLSTCLRPFFSRIRKLTCERMNDEEETCSICFQAFTNYGPHRLSCLKCGHLYGHGCIKVWLAQNDRCPQCNAKAGVNDIRVLYGRTLKILDTSERDRALEMAKVEKEKRIALEFLNAENKILIEMYQKQCQDLELQNKKLRYQVENQYKDDQNEGSCRLEKTIPISKNGSCRLLAYCYDLQLLVASQSISLPLVDEFGVRKLNVLDDIKCGEYVGLHKEAIKDMAFSPNLGYGPSPVSNEARLLSVSNGKSIHITSLANNHIIQKYNSDNPCWSCEWNEKDSNHFFVGTSNGQVSIYDIRNTTQSIKQIQYGQNHPKSPITSIKFVRPDCEDPRSIFRNGGIFVAQLKCCYFLQETSELDYIPWLLNIDGSLTDINYEPRTKHFLISMRPTTQISTCQHILCTFPETDCSTLIENSDNESQTSEPPATKSIDCNKIFTYKGGRVQTFLTKSHLFSPTMKLPQSCLSQIPQLYACAGDEESKALLVWETQTGNIKHKLPIRSAPIYDICSIPLSNNIIALSSKDLHIYKYNET